MLINEELLNSFIFEGVNNYKLITNYYFLLKACDINYIK
jgi:hypothetical protein